MFWRVWLYCAIVDRHECCGDKEVNNMPWAASATSGATQFTHKADAESGKFPLCAFEKVCMRTI